MMIYGKSCGTEKVNILTYIVVDLFYPGKLLFKYLYTLCLQASGFRMVAYWDNRQNSAYYDELGNRHDVCGEMLYVNSNWYNATFKETLRTTYDFQFKAPS